MAGPSPFREVFQEVFARLIEYSLQDRFSEGLEEALAFFYNLDEGEEYEFDAEQEFLFLTWFLIDDIDQEGTALADNFIEENRDEMNPQEIMLVDALKATHLSILQVVETVPGESLTLRDLFLRETFSVRETSISEEIPKGTLLFTRVLPMGEERFLVGAGVFLSAEALEPLTDFLAKEFQKESEIHPMSFRDFLKHNGELINWWIRAYQKGETLEIDRSDDDDDDDDGGPPDAKAR